MNLKKPGLTVGDLTITIGILIIGWVIWSNVGNKEESKQALHEQITSSILAT